MTSHWSLRGEHRLKEALHRSRVIALIFVLGVSVLTSTPALAEQSFWDAVRKPGHVVLLRHALAPGTGDPAEFTLGDCGTQRNLSDEGREQAKRIGDRFRTNGVDEATIFSSQWCRCLDTAALLDLGDVAELPALNSFYRHFEREKQQTSDLLAWISQRDLGGPVILVTHQVNITALTGDFPASGELFVARLNQDDTLAVVATLRTD